MVTTAGFVQFYSGNTSLYIYIYIYIYMCIFHNSCIYSALEHLGEAHGDDSECMNYPAKARW